MNHTLRDVHVSVERAGERLLEIIFQHFWQKQVKKYSDSQQIWNMFRLYSWGSQCFSNGFDSFFISSPIWEVNDREESFEG